MKETMKNRDEFAKATHVDTHFFSHLLLKIHV